MSTDWTTSLTAIVSAVIGGAIASLLAPFVAWQIEKKKIRLETRRQLIAAARAFLQVDHAKKEIAESDVYSRLRFFLNHELVKKLESDAILIELGGGRGAGVDNFSSKLLDEVARIEKEWDLI